MKKINFLFIFLLYFANSNCQQNNTFQINGKINGKSSGYLYLSYIDIAGNKIIDTAQIQNGSFLFSGSIIEPTFARIEGLKRYRNDKSNVIEFFLEPDTILISLIENNYKNAIIEGSITQDELTYLNNKKAQEVKEAFRLEEEFDSLLQKLANTLDETTRNSINSRQDEIRNLLKPFKIKLQEINFKFISENKSSYLAPHLMLIYLDELPWDSLKHIYEKWDYPIKESRNGKFIAQEIQKKELSSIGRFAPDFFTKDINNKDILLSSFKGKKTVLLDFWASWCIPCRNGNPHLLSLYKKYKSKGLEIIGISYDTNKEAWKKAIVQDGIDSWLHVLVAKDFKNITSNDILNNYEGPYIPIKILVNKEGIIIGKWIGESDEKKKEIENKIRELLE